MARAPKVPCPLSLELQKQIRRLKGKLRAPPAAVAFDSMHGKVTLPPPIAWLHAVEWPTGVKFRAKKPALDPASIEMQFMPVTESYGAQFVARPYVAVTYDSGQFYYFAALDSDDADPLVYHVDHEGEGNHEKSGTPLSQVLSKYVVEAPPAATTVIEIPDLELRQILERKGPLTKQGLARVDQLYILSGVHDMTGIEYCQKLKGLHFSQPTSDIDMRPVAQLSKLDAMTLKEPGDLGWMRSLTSLRVLGVGGPRFEVPFASLTSLTSSRLSWTEAPPSLVDLPRGLEELTMYGPRVIDALAPVLPELVNLKQLIVEGQPLDDLRRLAPLSKLTILVIESNATDTSSLAGLVGLSSLRIRGRLTSFDFVKALQGLTSVWLIGTSIASLAPLAEASVKSVAIDGCFSDLSPIAARPPADVWLSSDELEDLSPLAGISFKKIALGGRRVRDVSALANPDGDLPHLVLADAPVSDLSPLFGTRIKRVELGMAFTDYAQLLRIPGLEQASVRLSPGQARPAEMRLPNGERVIFINPP